MAIKSSRKTGIQYLGLGLFSLALILFTLMLGLDHYQLEPASLQSLAESTFSTEKTAGWPREALLAEAGSSGIYAQSYSSTFAFEDALNELFAGAQERIKTRIKTEGLPDGKQKWQVGIPDWVLPNKKTELLQDAAQGPVSGNPLLWFFLTFGLAIIGGLLYILPKRHTPPGIRHDHIYHNPLTRGLRMSWRGLFLGAAVIGIVGYGFYYMDKAYFWPA
ncbi:MAG: hypothetical protein D6772_02415, partial [Bacteroidetes bacterium]